MNPMPSCPHEPHALMPSSVHGRMPSCSHATLLMRSADWQSPRQGSGTTVEWVQLRYTFLDAVTGAPVTLPRTHITFYDLGTRCRGHLPRAAKRAAKRAALAQIQAHACQWPHAHQPAYVHSSMLSTRHASRRLDVCVIPSQTWGCKKDSRHASACRSVVRQAWSDLCSPRSSRCHLGRIKRPRPT